MDYKSFNGKKINKLNCRKAVFNKHKLLGQCKFIAIYGKYCKKHRKVKMSKLNRKFEYFTDFYDAYVISTGANKIWINCSHYRNKRIDWDDLREHYYKEHCPRPYEESESEKCE